MYASDFEKDLWTNGRNAMLFRGLEDRAVVNILRHCVDNRTEIDRHCDMRDVSFNLIPIDEVRNYMEYAARYPQNVTSAAFCIITGISKNHTRAFLMSARLHNASVCGDRETELDLKRKLNRYGLLEYMTEFNECVSNIILK